MKNNTNMLSQTGKTAGSKKQKSVRRWENYQTLNPLLYEGNQGKDHEGIAKNLALSNNMRLSTLLPHKSFRGMI